jgi:hypothetical protein
MLKAEVLGPAQVNATWDASLPHILVAKVDQHRADRPIIVVGFRSYHDVDDRFRDQPGHTSAPDVLYRNICWQAQ